MNRITRMDSAHERLPPLTLEPWSLDAAVVGQTEGSNPVAVFAPMHYEPSYRYPLLIWLHDDGDHEGQLRRVMPLLSMRNYVAVAPRGDGGAPRSGPGYCWRLSPISQDLAERRVLAAIDEARETYQVNERRIFLTGFGSGGTMALRLALAEPWRYAGVCALCGGVPSGDMPLARLKDSRQLPIFLAAGRSDTRYDRARLLADVRLLRSAGMDITAREYDVGHELSPAMLADCNRFMMGQVATAV
jgi:phospholipase/carboxylesterase